MAVRRQNSGTARGCSSGTVAEPRHREAIRQLDGSSTAVRQGGTAPVRQDRTTTERAAAEPRPGPWRAFVAPWCGRGLRRGSKSTRRLAAPPVTQRNRRARAATAPRRRARPREPHSHPVRPAAHSGPAPDSATAGEPHQPSRATEFEQSKLPTRAPFPPVALCPDYHNTPRNQTDREAFRSTSDQCSTLD